MAPSTKPLSLICLSTLLFMISPHLSLAIRESHFSFNNKAEEETSPTIVPESRNGYGLYGRHGHEVEDNQLVPATPDRDTRYGSTDFDAQFPRGVYTTGAYERGEYPNERYGMSDTRYLENGRYFYDVSKDSYVVDPRSTYGYAGYSKKNKNNNNNNGYGYSELKGEYGNQGEQGKGNEEEYVP